MAAGDTAGANPVVLNYHQLHVGSSVDSNSALPIDTKVDSNGGPHIARPLYVPSAISSTVPGAARPTGLSLNPIQLPRTQHSSESSNASTAPPAETFPGRHNNNKIVYPTTSTGETDAPPVSYVGVHQQYRPINEQTRFQNNTTSNIHYTTGRPRSSPNFFKQPHSSNVLVQQYQQSAGGDTHRGSNNQRGMSVPASSQHRQQLLLLQQQQQQHFGNDSRDDVISSGHYNQKVEDQHHNTATHRQHSAQIDYGVPLQAADAAMSGGEQSCVRSLQQQQSQPFHHHSRSSISRGVNMSSEAGTTVVESYKERQAIALAEQQRHQHVYPQHRPSDAPPIGAAIQSSTLRMGAGSAVADAVICDDNSNNNNIHADTTVSQDEGEILADILKLMDLLKP
eukprot:Lankesteria_metandrocarpae@DN1966_c0_g1_i1.p1